MSPLCSAGCSKISPASRVVTFGGGNDASVLPPLWGPDLMGWDTDLPRRSAVLKQTLRGSLTPQLPSGGPSCSLFKTPKFWKCRNDGKHLFSFLEKYNRSKSPVKGPSVSPARLAVSPLPFSSHLRQRSHLRFTAPKRPRTILLGHWMRPCCATARHTGRTTEEKQMCNDVKKHNQNTFYCFLPLFCFPVIFVIPCAHVFSSRLLVFVDTALGVGGGHRFPRQRAQRMCARQHTFSSILLLKSQNLFILKSSELNVIRSSFQFKVSSQFFFFFS